jgi:NADH-ubiquinone oxidoreductase-F iron-sulfur binding region/ApbE family/SLBB domain
MANAERRTPNASAAPGWKSIKFNPETRTVLLPHGIEIDLGATAKGLAADMAAAAAQRDIGRGGVLVSLGGDIAVAGTSPRHGWVVQVSEDSTDSVEPSAERIAFTSGSSELIMAIYYEARKCLTASRVQAPEPGSLCRRTLAASRRAFRLPPHTNGVGFLFQPRAALCHAVVASLPHAGVPSQSQSDRGGLSGAAHRHRRHRSVHPPRPRGGGRPLRLLLPYGLAGSRHTVVRDDGGRDPYQPVTALVRRRGLEGHPSPQLPAVGHANGSSGALLVTVSGAVKAPGVREVAQGTTVSQAIEAAGGATTDISAVLLGGYFGGWVAAGEASELHLDAARLRAGGRSLGCGVVHVLPSHACGVAEAAAIMGYLASESARQCGPCHFGLRAMSDAVTRIASNTGEPGDLMRLTKWSREIRGRGACNHPDGAAGFLDSALATFEHEFILHQEHRRCGVVQ